jgi:hypothetical protein
VIPASVSTSATLENDFLLLYKIIVKFLFTFLFKTGVAFWPQKAKISAASARISRPNA